MQPKHEKTIMPRSAKNVTEAQILIKSLIGKPITNDKFGITGYLTNRSIKKMGSGKATSKSISSELHAKAVANVDILFQNAEIDIVHGDKYGDRNIKQIHRLCTLMFDEKTNSYVGVMLTVKEFADDTENRIYSVEAIKVYKKSEPAGHTAAYTAGS
jgi:hypothetical protein